MDIIVGLKKTRYTLFPYLTYLYTARTDLLPMVFIVDEGSVFKGPLDKVWKLNASEGQHNHPSLKNSKAEPAGENAMILSYDVDMGGKTARVRSKLTMVPPLGTLAETLEGPMAGSKSFQFYTPRGNETGVTVVGQWKSSVMSDDQIRTAVMGFLQTVFDEDQANLSKV
jgi:hypothetical protein